MRPSVPVGVVGAIDAWFTLSLNSMTIGTVPGQPPSSGTTCRTRGRPSRASPSSGTTCTIDSPVVGCWPDGSTFGSHRRPMLSHAAVDSAAIDSSARTATTPKWPAAALGRPAAEREVDRRYMRELADQLVPGVRDGPADRIIPCSRPGLRTNSSRCRQNPRPAPAAPGAWARRRSAARQEPSGR